MAADAEIRKSMSWDDWSNIMLIVTAVVAVLTFISGVATAYITYKAGKDKDAKAAAQEERIAALDAKRAEAERDLALINERMQPRSLSDQQAASILSNLAGFETGEIHVRIIGANPEAMAFARQILATLNAGGWKTYTEIDLNGRHSGLLFVYSKQAATNANNLQEAFTSAGLTFAEQTVEKKHAYLMLSVGAKP